MQNVWVRGEAYTGFWWRNLRERDRSGDPGIDGWIILRWIIRKLDVAVWAGSSWLMIGISGGTCECGNEPSGSIKSWKFLD